MTREKLKMHRHDTQNVLKSGLLFIRYPMRSRWYFIDLFLDVKPPKIIIDTTDAWKLFSVILSLRSQFALIYLQPTTR